MPGPGPMFFSTIVCVSLLSSQLSYLSIAVASFAKAGYTKSSVGALKLVEGSGEEVRAFVSIKISLLVTVSWNLALIFC